MCVHKKESMLCTTCHFVSVGYFAVLGSITEIIWHGDMELLCSQPTWNYLCTARKIMIYLKLFINQSKSSIQAFNSLIFLNCKHMHSLFFLSILLPYYQSHDLSTYTDQLIDIEAYDRTDKRLR